MKKSDALVTVDDSPLPVATDIPDPIVADEEAWHIFKRFGLSNISRQSMNDMARLGIYVKGIGVLRNQRGSAVLTQQRLGTIMETLGRAVELEWKGKRRGKMETIAKLAQSFGYLVSKMTESQRLLIEMEGGFTAPVRKAESAGPMVQSFMPGQDVQPNSTMVLSREVHIHNCEQMPLKSPVPPC